jgi:hypothetical protein
MVSSEQSREPEQAAPAAIGKYEVHPLANFFPILAEGTEQYQNLYDDIVKYIKVREPVVLFEGKILDGRNRALIAQKVGVKFKVVHFEALNTGKSALDYVYSANLNRRHLTDKERSDLAVKRVKQIEEERAANLASPNSGNMFPLADERGQGKKGPAAIAAAQTGLTKQAVNKAVARDKNRSKTREEAMAKIAPELRAEVLEDAKQTWLKSGVSQAKGTGIPTASGLDKSHKRVLAARAAKERLPEQMDPDRAIRRICNVVHATFDQENYRAVRTALETGAWRLSERDLIGLATVSDGLIPKLIDCIRLLPAKIRPVQETDISFEGDVL